MISERQLLAIVIPDDLDFADPRLARDPNTGEVVFNWEPIDRICRASGIDVAVFRDQHEDNVSGLIVHWYQEHLAHGRARDPVQDELLAEVIAEDALGGGISYQPGRA